MEYGHVLADDEKRELLRIARATLREHTFSGRIPPGKPHRDSLCATAGVFVTLHEGDELRGCIGTIEAEKPLYRIIQEMAVAAGTRDPRFPPVTEEELDDLTIEISVLGHTRAITTPEQIVIGVDGLWIDVGDQRGLLLPQVATQAGWDGATFLAKTCHKAGLEPDAWKQAGAKVTAFKAQVFSDLTHPKLPGAR